jgi:8-oxo-dGTP diphosphatase
MQPLKVRVPSIDVVAAVLKDRLGRVLIAERPAGKPLAGYWEFPGGKLEAGEPAAAALQRELKEELGIEVRRAYRLLQFSHQYPERRVDLDVWRVTAHTGEPAAHEGQRLAWVTPQDFPEWNLLPADQPIVSALRLPPLMLVTPASTEEAGFLSGLMRSLAAGVDFVQFRAPDLASDRFERLARASIAACREYGARVSINSRPDTALKLGADGVHLSAREWKALGPGFERAGLLVGLSCHDAEEIAAARKLRPDYLVVGTVQATPSHGGSAPLGWERFAELAKSTDLPVYAIGGLQLGDLKTARGHGAHGIAAVRSLWETPQLSEVS